MFFTSKKLNILFDSTVTHKEQFEMKYELKHGMQLVMFG